MPARIDVQKDGLEASWDDVRGDMLSMCRKHAKGVHVLVVNRLDRGPGTGPLKSRVYADRDEAETPEELAASLTDETMKLIVRDAMRPRGRGAKNPGEIGPWVGSVQLFDKAERKPLDTLAIHIEDPQGVVTAESEIVAMMKEQRAFFTNMNTGVVAIYTALGKREKQQAKLFGALAKAQGRMSKSAARWKYKTVKEQEKTERDDVGSRERIAKSKFFWSAMETGLAEWVDVAEIWSKFYTVDRKPGEPRPAPPTRPTHEECTSIFSKDEIFEKQYPTDEGDKSVRAVVAEMIVEPDVARRIVLAKLLVRVAAQIPNALARLEAAIVSAIESEARRRSIVAWLRLPIT